MIPWLYGLDLLFLVYFIAVNLYYVSLNGLSALSISRYMPQRRFEDYPEAVEEGLPPITVLIPAYNEELTVEDSVRASLNVDYPNLEVIVVDDGSTDGTLDLLKEQFDLVPNPDVYREQISTETVHEFFHSEQHSNLRVITKDNGGAEGGRADALNAGLNVCTTPLVCVIDADSVLEPSSLRIMIRPFLTRPETVAAGGTVRVANGCEIEDGEIKEVGISDRFLPRCQTIEYLRSFLFGRAGLAEYNGLLSISGAFGLFRRDLVNDLGGFSTETVADDMEIVVRLHRLMQERNQPYHIAYVPDPICWTVVPETFRSLRNQRIRWQQGIAESLAANRSLCARSGGGFVSWFSFPTSVLFESLGAVIEVLGYTYMVVLAVLALLGLHSPAGLVALLVVAVGLGVVSSVFSLLIEVMTFNVYSKPSQLALLFGMAFVENLGYRQVNSLWRTYGLFRWLSGVKGRRGAEPLDKVALQSQG